MDSCADRRNEPVLGLPDCGPGTRYVVFDQETTGLDPKKDRLVSIGAIVFQDGEIHLDETFEMLVRFDYNTAAVLVHGVTKEAAAHAADEATAVKEFLDFCGDSVFVGHHVLFDFEVLRRAALRQGFPEPNNACLDTMAITLALADAGALPEKPERFDFDTLCACFAIPTHDRHTAAGDAFLTALIFQRLWKRAHETGFNLAILFEIKADNSL